MKKIYIATSWKMEKYARLMAKELREVGHEVDCFCDESTGRFVFSVKKLKGMPIDKLDAITFLDTKEAQKAFKEDKKWIKWCDTLILLLPSGRSAHLEAGYAKGIGKEVIIVGEFPNGEFDVMYGFADLLLPTSILETFAHISTFITK
ncbi:hypothetical protein KAR91_83030 [Candidatus Pacearchaeota archaeon]|nr:hypothetical protein [Candidatus Pacearchaeota archaeon]